MAVNSVQRQGQTAQPALTGVIVAVLVWLILTMAGNDLVNNPEDISSRTSVAVLAVMKDARLLVAGAVGFLVFLWLWQLKRGQAGAWEQEQAFMEWSAELPQWKPQLAHGETAAFFVPVARVESGEYQRPAAAAGSLSQPRPVPVPVAASAASAGPLPAMRTQSVPVIRLMPLQQMAERVAAARIQGGSSMPLLAPAAQQAAGLVRANRVQIPSNLPLATLSRMPHTQLESLVGEYYRRLGYDVAALGTGDDSESIDLLLQRKGEIIVVKCLTGGADKVPPDPARELLGLVMGEGATRGILITTAAFSRKAVKFVHQKGRGRLELVDGRKLEGMFKASAAGAGLSPACPCCNGPMRMAQKKKRFGRSAMSWVCERAPACQGVLRPGQTAAAPAKRLAA